MLEKKRTHLVIQNLQACVHKPMGGNLHFRFCGSVIPVSYNNYKYWHNVFANVLFHVASHSFLRVVVYFVVNPNAIAALAKLQTR